MTRNGGKPNHQPEDDIILRVVRLIGMVAFFPIALLACVLGGGKGEGGAAGRSKTFGGLNRSEKARAGKNRPEPRGRRGGRLPGKIASVVLMLASVLLLTAAAGLLLAALIVWAGGGGIVWPLAILCLFHTAGGGICLLARGVYARRLSRFKQYCALIGPREMFPIADIASAVGVSEKCVLRDLPILIDAGLFGGGAYIDRGLGSFVRSAEAADAAREAEARREAEAARRAAADAVRAATAGQSGASPGTEHPYMSVLLEIRSLNDAIADASISEKIIRIEELTGKIFRIVEETPGKAPQIRRFMNYYLPTTLKLLRSYATLEKQGIRGENIAEAKGKIGRILDTLTIGYEQQLDLLFRADVIDITADIQVLESMMMQDGLAGERQSFGADLAGTELHLQ